MAGLIEKMNSLPKEVSVDMEEIVDAKKEETKVEAENPVESPPETVAEPVKKADSEEQEPPKTASKAEKDAYKARRVKAADDEKAEAKAEASRLKKENDDLQKQRDDWKKQAETIAQRQPAPAPSQPQRGLPQQPSIDINKDPVGYLSKGLDEANKRLNAYENRELNNAAHDELAGLESEASQSDYKDVMEHAANAEVAKMKIINPNLSEAAVRSAFKQDKIKAAVMFIAQGKDPVEGLYNLAKAGYGYQPKPAAETKEDAAKVKASAEKSRFDAVNKNKSKSATGLSAGGSTGDVEVRGPATTKKRTLGEFAKLTKAQKDADYVQE